MLSLDPTVRQVFHALELTHRTSNHFDTFSIRTDASPLEQEVHVALPSREFWLDIDVGFHPGGTLQQKTDQERLLGYEDRSAVVLGSDGTVILLAIDGVGEVYTTQLERSLYDIEDDKRVLGDIPGLMLYRTLQQHAQINPQSLHTREDLREVIRGASIAYQQFLVDAGLDHLFEGRKEQLGGCTFAMCIIPPIAPPLLASAGDAIALAETSEGIVGTKNQLPEVNLTFEPLRDLLQHALKEAGSSDPHRDMRAVLNKLLKSRQRNGFTNVEHVEIDKPEILRDLREALSGFNYLSDPQRLELILKADRQISDLREISGYAFFDGNPACADATQIIKVLDFTTCFVLSDGAFNNKSSDMAEVYQQVLQVWREGGMSALRDFNQVSNSGPEATVLIGKTIPMPKSRKQT